MIGMGFTGFGTLLILGFLGSFTLHFLLRYRVLTGPDGVVSAWVVAWLGAWLGSPVLGHWGPHVGVLYVLPGLLGAFALPFLAVSAFRALGRMLQTSRPEMGFSQPGSERVEMRKAS
jgi:uncharacterized membrane protein YeaQ/YmgE (transglycosylase-associated protein family)